MASKQKTVQAAVIQHAPVFLNLEASVRKATALIEEAADQGAEVITFPETWLPGYPLWLDFAPNAALWDHPPAKALYRLLAENALTLPSTHLDHLLHAAGKTGTTVIMGAHERAGGTLYNTMLFLDRNGRDCHIHRKLMPTYTERLVWGRGDGSTLSTVDTPFGKLGGLVCWEHWMPLARAAMHAQNEVVHVAQWPAVKELHLLASRHYAFEGQCYVLAAGTVLYKRDLLAGLDSLGQADSPAREILDAIPGEEDALIHNGGSAIIGPDGQLLTGPVYESTCILTADLDLERITEGHLALDTDGHYARPDVFRLTVNTQPQVSVVWDAGNGTHKGA